MKPIAIFYHTLFHLKEPVPAAMAITEEAMRLMRESELLQNCQQLTVGINGTPVESERFASTYLPNRARIIWHGLQSRSENLTIIEIEKFVKDNPGWCVLYFHCKGATHTLISDYGMFAGRWRRCMLRNLVTNWQQCVKDLHQGYDAVGCHWMTGMGVDKSQHYFAGNFFWATSDFLATVPSMFLRDRIKMSGIDSYESRYEAEVWIGNGKLPKIKDYATHSLMSCP